MMRECTSFSSPRWMFPGLRVGRTQTVETLINEEALLLAKFLRDVKMKWIPRVRVL